MKLPTLNRHTIVGWIVVVAVLAGTVGWLAVKVHDERAERSVADQALVAGTTAVETVLSYQAASVGEDLARSEDLLTGAFLKRFRTTVPQIQTAATKEKISTSAVVSESGVVEVESSDAVVLLLFVNQNTTSTAAKQPQQQGTRLKVRMEKADGTWLIAELDQI